MDKVLVLIEEHDDNGVNWIVSFDGSNPEREQCFIAANKDEAKRALDLIEDLVKRMSPNLG